MPFWKPAQLTVHDSQQTLSSWWQIQSISSRKTWDVWFAETNWGFLYVLRASVHAQSYSMAVEQTQAPLRRWSSSFAPYNSILHTRSLVALYTHGCRRQLVGFCNELTYWLQSALVIGLEDAPSMPRPIPLHLLILLATRPCCISWATEKRFTRSRPPAIPLFCQIRMPHQNWTMSLRESAKKLRKKATMPNPLLLPLFAERRGPPRSS